MKITSFNPLILTKNPDEAISLFEELGFKRKHAPTVDTGTGMVTNVTMEDGNDFHVDVAGVESVPQDVTIIRMNVDDFDEALEFLKARGFKRQGTKEYVENSSSKSAMVVSPSGFAFDLCQHIKK